MLKFVVFTILAALVLADQDQEHSHEGDVDVRVVGGTEVQPHTWPWQISLKVEKHNEYRHTCGGTLIRPGWVMTAAHCIHDDTTYRVDAGKHNITKEESTEQRLNVSHIYVHPQWNASRLTDGYDIALLELSTPASLNENVKVATLPPSGQILPNTTQCFTTGWGYTHGEVHQVKDVLQEAHLPLLDYSTCSSERWWYHAVKESMICAGGDGKGSACQGDSGGPLNCKVDDEWVVHGVTSFVYNPCNNKMPSVFTRVSEYNDWINNTID